MDLCKTLCMSVRLVFKKSSKTFQTLFSIPPNRHYWLLPLYTTFTDLDLSWGREGGRVGGGGGGGHMFSAKQKLIGFIFSRTFHVIGMKFGMVMNQFRLNILGLFWVRFSETKEITFSLADSIENLKSWHVFGCLRKDLIKAWYGDRYYCSLDFDTSLIDFGLDSRTQECDKANTIKCGKANTFNFAMCQNTCEQMCFKLGMVPNTTKHYS